MRGVLTIYRREIAGLFVGPLAWLLLCAALAVGGWDFVATLRATGGDVTTTLRAAAGGSLFTWLLLFFLPPLLTMRMISEESRSGMLEFLLTAPVTDRAVVTGKFLAAATLMALLWSSKLLYGLALQLLGTAPDWMPLLGGFAGLVLISSLYCALGLLASALVDVPLLAAFLALVASVMTFMLPDQVRRLGDREWLERVLDLTDLWIYFEPFLNGVVDTASLVYFAGWTAATLFLATRAVEMRRWR